MSKKSSCTKKARRPNADRGSSQYVRPQCQLFPSTRLPFVFCRRLPLQWLGESHGSSLMSRGFDGFEIDDFRDSQWEPKSSGRSRESSRGRGSGSQTEASVRMKLAKLRETEYQFDHLDSQSRERSEAKPPSFSRDTRQADLLAQRERTEIRDRDRCYSLRPSEIHTLTEVGKFRVVALEDLTNCA